MELLSITLHLSPINQISPTAYAQELIAAAGKSFTSTADDATLTVGGGGAAAAQSAYNNFWGTIQGKPAWASSTSSYFQHEYAVQVFTGTVPKYDEATGNKLPCCREHVLSI